MWDEFGLERIVDITGQHHKYTMAILSDTMKPDVSYMNAMLLRARFNPQRAYEIYYIGCDGIDEDDMVEMFREDPQYIVDLIRENGVRLFSQKCPENRRVIM